VLVAAATADQADSLQTLLTVWGCDVRAATDGAAAVAVADAFSPHVALLDLRLAGLDGSQVARRLRDQSRVDKVKLVALTSADGAPGHGRAEGFDYFLSLPVDPESLRRIVTE
jgi:CheY-like chemotaxis protein